MNEVEELKDQVKLLNQIVFIGDGPDKPSLVTSLATLNTQIETVVSVLTFFKAIAFWGLLVIVALLVSNTFFGPIIRRSIGLPDAKNVPALHQESQLNARVPYIPETR